MSRLRLFISGPSTAVEGLSFIRSLSSSHHWQVHSPINYYLYQCLNFLLRMVGRQYRSNKELNFPPIKSANNSLTYIRDRSPEHLYEHDGTVEQSSWLVEEKLYYDEYIDGGSADRASPRASSSRQVRLTATSNRIELPLPLD